MKNKKDSQTLNLCLAKTNAERQRDYRERQKLKNGKRLDLFIPNDVSSQLEKIAEYKGLTVKNVLIDLISAEHRKLLESKVDFQSSWTSFFEANNDPTGLEDFNPRD